jgi:starvation-inducible DNA-binding protein
MADWQGAETHMSAQIREVKTKKNKLSSLPHKTKNNLDEKARAKSVELLNARLADGIDLALATKQAHWNLRGPQFIAIHEMLDTFREELDAGNNLIAERASQLGGVALGTTQVVADATTVAPYPVDIFSIEDHLAALIERYGTVANAMREAIDTSDEAGDIDTSDIFTEVSRLLDKDLWFLESHLLPVT